MRATQDRVAATTSNLSKAALEHALGQNPELLVMFARAIKDVMSAINSANSASPAHRPVPTDDLVHSAVASLSESAAPVKVFG